ncbi:MAG: molybdopterin dinucleotide binding domain-containing protein, partial [Myxococcota bacterium]|nr:molybdopterin dinucleotide binding domain-containing protein [Myxococcota bacterium]
AGGLDEGESDRSIWRVSREDGRIELFPEGTDALLEAADAEDAEPGMPLRLRTSLPHAADRDAPPGPGGGAWIMLHPDLGFENGARVRVRTRHGSTEGTAVLDDRLRPDTVDIPRDAGLRATGLLSASRLDALVGTAERDGLPCAVEPVESPAVG